MNYIVKVILVFMVTSICGVLAQSSAPDDAVTKSDIKKCVKKLKKTENFLYPNSLKVESATYVPEGSKIILTLTLSQKTEYGASAGVEEKQCTLEK